MVLVLEGGALGTVYIEDTCGLSCSKGKFSSEEELENSRAGSSKEGRVSFLESGSEEIKEGSSKGTGSVIGGSS